MRRLILALLLAPACGGPDDQAWYRDLDGDGYGSGLPVAAAEAPDDHVASGGDCHDGDPLAYPGAEERCNGVDDDCDGVTDEDAPDSAGWWRDGDGDGFGDPDDGGLSCQAPPGTAPNPDDCDDADPAIHPGHPEVCDGVDNDCDEEADGADAEDATPWYPDADEDGFGDPDGEVLACLPPSGHVADGTDCDDEDDTRYPGAEEVCDDQDDDCDGVEDGPWATGAVPFFADGDDDGFGDPDAWTLACSAPDDHVAAGGDCDDEDDTRYPGADEQCDDEDDDCDGAVDEDPVDAPAWYWDVDEDGHGRPDVWWTACDPPSGAVEAGGDCDDLDDAVYPGADEVCDNHLDDDCSGEAVACELRGSMSTPDADAVLWDDVDGAYLGYRTAVADLDADGTADVVVSTIRGRDGAERGDVWVVRGPVAASVDLPARAHARFVGEPGDRAGTAWIPGDLDGDGLADLAIGAVGHDATRDDVGAVHVLLAPVPGGTRGVDAAELTVTGLATGDQMGRTPTGRGDFDGDGFDDLVVAAPGYDLGDEDVGAVGVFLGPLVAGEYLLSEADVLILGAEAGSRLGHTATFVGDQDGDGDDELLVGSASDSSTGCGAAGCGAAYLFAGGTTSATWFADLDHTARLAADASDDSFGPTVWRVGDVDGDGVEDLGVACPSDDTWHEDSGRLDLFLGPISGDLAPADAWLTVYGEGYHDVLGRDESGTEDGRVAHGDVNADGADDLVIGVSQATGDASRSGVVAVFYGPLSPGTLDLSDGDLLLSGTQDYGKVGNGLAVGDLDGDGRDDLLVGETSWDPSAEVVDAGQAYVVYGHGR